ncbi:MAG: glutaredoxin family protein [Leptodesmis sp.]|uniref:glutaredoxin family protein n=1 Tax=Leptodesmis sp. TaxID=3100501 RepID=UPI003D09EF41
MRLILYSKPGCHLCEGLQEKLEQIQTLKFDLEVRDITTREDWFQQYQYEIPVLFLEIGHEAQDTGQETNYALIPLPRPSPRSSIPQLERLLQKYLHPVPQE